MKLTIETYWNKVQPDCSAPFGTRVLPEYELKSTVTYPDSGWTQSDWERSVKARNGFVGFVDGAAKFDQGRNYGIHSYQLVRVQP